MRVFPPLDSTKKKILWYSKKQKEAKIVKSALWIPGEHNVSNALSALFVARFLGVSDKKSVQAVSQ